MEKYNAQKYDGPPEAYGAFAYAAMDMILNTIEKVGPDRKKVIADLGNVKDRDSIVGKITFDDHGQNTVAVITKYVIQDGKFVEWDDSEYASGKRKLPGQKIAITIGRGSVQPRLIASLTHAIKTTSWMWGCSLNMS